MKPLGKGGGFLDHEASLQLRTPGLRADLASRVQRTGVIAAAAVGFGLLFVDYVDQPAFAQSSSVASGDVGSIIFTLPRPLDELERQRRAGEGEEPLSPDAELPFTFQTPPENADEISFTLREVEIIGAEAYDELELSDAFVDFLGEEITLAQLFAIAADIQEKYRADGYIFTRVLIPAQRIETGSVQIAVVEAVISKVEIEAPADPLGPVEELAARFAAPLEGLRNPTAREIERVLLLLNDIPGISRASAVPKLGDAGRGSVELYINMERDALELTLFADNRQSPIVGRGLIGAIGSFNSWSPFGDSTTLSFFNSADFDDPFPDDFQERWTVQLEHIHFLGDQGTRLEFQALHSQSRPGGVVSDFDIEADQTEISLGARHPFLRSRALTLEAFGGVEFINATSLTPAPTLGGVTLGQDLEIDDQINVLFAGVDASRRDRWGVSEAIVEARMGVGLLGASEAGDADLSRGDGDGTFLSLQAELNRTVVLDERRSLWVAARGQYADRPLLASEEMSIGGNDLGRAFHPGEVSGDMGIGFAAELRHSEDFRLRGARITYELYGFADWAEIRNLENGTPNHAALASAGAGLRAVLPGSVAVNLEAAKPLNRGLSYDRSDDWRLLFSATKEF